MTLGSEHASCSSCGRDRAWREGQRLAARLPARTGQRVAGLSEASHAEPPRRIEPSPCSAPSSSPLVAFCVVFPLVLVVVQSFQVAPPGQPARYGLDGWRAALGEPGLRGALSQHVHGHLRAPASLAAARRAHRLAARAHGSCPAASWIEFAFWAAFFLPSFTVTLSWILLLDPEYGLINTALATLPFVGTGPFNIYSFWGIVWVHVVTGSVTVKVILLTPAFAT